MSWIQTFTGKKFDILAPRPEDVDIRDIAHALSLLCRFGGHCRRFYSVAEHSILVSNVSYNALWGLLHDAAEAYLIDLPRPIKRALVGYKEAEIKVQEAICLRFGLGLEMPADVKVADERALLTEAKQLMEPLVDGWLIDLATEPIAVRIGGMQPERAEREFLRLFFSLGGSN